jgi:predicted TIM-barrel fold metal-dependent hydrolase
VVGEIREKIASLPVESQRKVLGENAVRFYGLAPAAASPRPS